MSPVYSDKKTGRLYIEFQFKGTRIKERLPEHVTKREAEAYEIRLKNDILKQIHGMETPRQQVSFRQFLAEYFGLYAESNYSPESFERVVPICEAALLHFKDSPLRSIKPADVEAFKAKRRSLITVYKKLRKPSTIEREMAILSKIFSLAVKNDFIDFNPCSRVEKIKFDNLQDRILRDEDEPKLFEHIHGEFTRDVCKFVLNTGLRQNDVLNLTRFNIDVPERVLRLTQGKTRQQVRIPLNDEAFAILERRMQKHESLLFPSPVTGRNDGRVRHTLRRACLRAGIEIVTIRDLRRTYAARLEANGVSTGTIAKLLGHRDRRSIHRYERSFDAMRNAVDLLTNPAKIPPASRLKVVK